MIKDIKISNCTFVLLENGDLWGCGSNLHGKLGIGNIEQINTFTKICEDVKMIKCYWEGTFLLKNDKTLWFAGNGLYLGKKGNITFFVKIADKVEDIIFWPPYGVKENLFCLKSNGNLLDLRNYEICLSNVKKITEGIIDEDFCLFIIKEDNSLFYFKENTFNKIGFFSKIKSIFSNYKTPIFIQKIDNTLWQTKDYNFKKSIKIFDDIKDVKIFSDNSFFLKKNGDLFVLGKNFYGKLGIKQKEINIPTLVAKNVKEVCPTYSFTFILKDDNSLWGCGDNVVNIFGNKNGCYYSFRKICDNVKNFYTDNYSLFIIKQNNELWISGGYKMFFQGTDYLRFVSNNVKNIFFNSNSFFIIKNDNTLLCFGDNEYGQLGIGLKKKQVNRLVECTTIKNYYNIKETVKVIKDVFKGRNL